MADIVERLRLFVPHCEDPNDYLEDELLFLKAADQIERLRQQVGMLEMSNAMSEATISDMGKKIEHLRRIVINLLDDGDETDCAEARAALGEGK